MTHSVTRGCMARLRQAGSEHRYRRPARPASEEISDQVSHRSLRNTLTPFASGLAAVITVSLVVGSFGVLTHPIDEQVRQFYRRWGFEDVPFDPRQLMIVRMVDLQKSGLVA